MIIRPIGERVLLKPLKQEEKTKSGLYLPESKEQKKQGIVIEIGEDKEGKMKMLKKGDVVMYGGYSSEEFENDKEKYIIVEFKDIIARLE